VNRYLDTFLSFVTPSVFFFLLCFSCFSFVLSFSCLVLISPAMSNFSPDQLAAMLERLNYLESSRPAPESPLPSAPLADKYNGSRKAFRSFLCQLELVFRVDPRYRDDKVKIAILGTLLKVGGAMAWLMPYLEHADQHEALLSDYSQFRKLFSSVFGDTDRVALASSRLRDLGQGRRPALAYATEFRELAAVLQWNDAAFIDQVRAGLL
jgi:hypothetical protein